MTSVGPQSIELGLHPDQSVASNGGSVSSTSTPPVKPFPRGESTRSRVEKAKLSTAPGYEGLKMALNAMPLPGPAPTPMDSTPASASSVPRPKSTRDDIVLGIDSAVSITGFQTMRLNGIYVLKADTRVNSHGTYWDHKGRIFMYYQPAKKRWALSPRSQDGKDFMKDGCTVSIAHETETPGVWIEYFQDVWTKSNLVISAVRSHVAVPVICPVTEKASHAVASGGSSHQHIRRNIIARRQSVGQDQSQVRVYSDKSVIGSLEPHIQRTLEHDQKVEEVLVSREGDTVRVSFQFRDDQPKQRAEAVVASLFSGVSGEWRSIDESEYSRVKDRCANHICEARKIPKFEGAVQAPIELGDARDRSSSGSKKGSRKRKRDEKTSTNSKNEQKEKKNTKDTEDWEMTTRARPDIKAKVAKDLENDKKK